MNGTVLEQKHIQLGAKMAPFAGFNMPISYTSVNTEHLNVRKYAGLFDVSHMGEIWVTGKGADQLVQFLTSNDIYVLKNGQAQYNCFPNGKGGIVDDLIVYKFDQNRYFLVVNAANIEKDYNWVVTNNKFGASVDNVSDQYALLALQGPNALPILKELTNEKVDELKFYSFLTGEIEGIKEVIISATGYTGAGGFEIYVKNEYAGQLWDTLINTGKKYQLIPVGLAARDTLRLEMGYCLYGNDIDDSTSPIEAGLSWITKLNDVNKCIDYEFLKNQAEKGVSKKLKGFILNEMGIPRPGYTIMNEAGNKIGSVTSGTMSPMLKKGIGLGYIDINMVKKDEPIYIEIRNKRINATITRPPFI